MAKASSRPGRRKNNRRKKRSLKASLLRWLVIGCVVLVILCIPLLLWLDYRVAQQLDAHHWTIPAKVFARPLELFVGSAIARKDVLHELKLLGYQAGNGDEPGSYRIRGGQLQLHTRGFLFGDGRETARAALLDWHDGRVSSVRSGGQSVDLLRLEPLQIGGIYPGHNEDRLLVALEDAPKGMLEALLAVEDRGFYEHFGLSLRGIARAMWVNIRQGRFVQGGSTITQQLVKNLFLSQERSLARKLPELPMAILLERRASKDQILRMFLNEVFLAQDGGRAIHGFGLASQYFFNQPLNELLPHQYALLIGMIKGPSYYSPIRYPKRTLKRRNLVLTVMAEHGIMQPAEADYAKQLPLGLNTQTASTARQPAYLDLVRRQLAVDYRLEDLQSEGLRIFTNFNPLVQRAAEHSLSLAFADIDKRPARTEATDFKPAELEAAMLVSDAATGEVVALIGGRRPRYAGFNRALDARRPVGSLIKPAIYLSALELPDRYTLASRINDERFALPQPDGSVWSPDNFDQQSHGPVMLLDALSHSYNQASAALGLELGVDRVRQTLRELGLEGDIPELPSVFLGAIELSLYDVATMYQTLSSGGFNTPLRAIREILDANGQAIKHYGLDIEQRIAPDSLHLILFALQEAMRNGTGRSAYHFIPKNLAVAGKTGTSNGQRDSWFAGFGGDYLAVAWMGNDDYQTTSLTGSSGALRAWAYLFREIGARSLDFVPPPGIEYAWTDEQTGKRSQENCQSALYLPYIAGTEPLQFAPCSDRSRRVPNWFRWFLGEKP